jgi:glycosyltransferase involved in cell wall biosynthesis
MLVSVVVLTRNSAEFLRDCLASIQWCREFYPDIEVIVVDNFSTDDTVDIAYDFTDQVYQVGPERVTQANYGVKMAKGELIYLTGSDMTRDYLFIQEAVEKINEGFDAIYMSVKTSPRVKHFWGRVKALERECYIGTFIESARFFKKSAWEEFDGFNEKMIGLEEDFQHRLDYSGYKTGRINAREYHLHEDDTLWKIFKKGFYYGKFMRKYLTAHKQRAWKQLNPIRPNFSKFLRHPGLLAGLVVYKLAQYAGGGLGLLWN